MFRGLLGYYGSAGFQGPCFRDKAGAGPPRDRWESPLAGVEDAHDGRALRDAPISVYLLVLVHDYWPLNTPLGMKQDHSAPRNPPPKNRTRPHSFPSSSRSIRAFHRALHTHASLTTKPPERGGGSPRASRAQQFKIRHFCDVSQKFHAFEEWIGTLCEDLQKL